MAAAPRSAMEFELNKLSTPRIFLFRMLVFLVACGLVAVVLYKQIQQASTGLGVTGMEAIFGKPKNVLVDATKANSDVSKLRDTLNSLHDKAITIHLKVEGSASLDPGLVKGLLQQFQEELLKQARRNTKTGILLKSKR